MKQVFPFPIDERFLLRLLDMQPIAIVLVHKRKMVFATRYLETILGWRVEEVLGQSTEIFFPSRGSWESFGRIMYSALEKNEEHIFQWGLVTKSGERRICEIYTQRIEKLDDSWLVLSSIRDVTEEIKNKEKLHEEKVAAEKESEDLRTRLDREVELLRLVIRHLPMGFGILHDGKFVHKNQRLLDHIGERLDQYLEGCSLLDRATKFHQEMIDIRKDSEVRYILFTKFWVEEGDYCFIITQDITDTVKMQKDIDLIVEARAASALSGERLALMGRLLSEIIHEINTPLTYMKTNLHVFEAYISGIRRWIEGLHVQLEKKMEVESLLKETSEIMKSLDFGVQKIENIVRSVKAFSRPKDKLLEEAGVELSFAIRDAVVLTWNRLKRWMKVYVNGHQILQDFEVPNLRVKIRGEQALIVQLFVILFNNALEAAMERRIKGACCWVEVSVTRDEVCVSFRDNCGGIEASQVSRLFESFYTSKEEGTGLGLWILKEIMNALGGTLEARNTREPRGFQVMMRFKRAG